MHYKPSTKGDWTHRCTLLHLSWLPQVFRNTVGLGLGEHISSTPAISCWAPSRDCDRVGLLPVSWIFLCPFRDSLLQIICVGIWVFGILADLQRHQTTETTSKPPHPPYHKKYFPTHSTHDSAYMVIPRKLLPSFSPNVLLSNPVEGRLLKEWINTTVDPAIPCRNMPVMIHIANVPVFKYYVEKKLETLIKASFCSSWRMKQTLWLVSGSWSPPVESTWRAYVDG